MTHHHHEVSGKNLFITIILNIIITVAQIIGGILSGSLALLSDAMHNFSDVVALIIAYVANRLASQPHTQSKTFGYKRAEVLAAFINASVLIGIGIFLIIESINKLYHPHNIDSVLVIWLGLLSIVLNAISVLLVKDDSHKNMNIKAAYLHLLTDVMTSLAVVVGGILMYYYNLFWIDPVISATIAIYLIWASVGLVKKSVSILMQFAPKEINIDEVVEFIKDTQEIKNVHHLHLWKLDEHSIHLEAHLDFNENVKLEESNEVLAALEKTLHTYFEITHTTFQCEYNRHGDKSVIV
jgi:cobalt-zinc-cadmium efflux system protein